MKKYSEMVYSVLRGPKKKNFRVISAERRKSAFFHATQHCGEEKNKNVGYSALREAKKCFFGLLSAAQSKKVFFGGSGGGVGEKFNLG